MNDNYKLMNNLERAYVFARNELPSEMISRFAVSSARFETSGENLLFTFDSKPRFSYKRVAFAARYADEHRGGLKSIGVYKTQYDGVFAVEFRVNGSFAAILATAREIRNFAADNGVAAPVFAA